MNRSGGQTKRAAADTNVRQLTVVSEGDGSSAVEALSLNHKHAALFPPAESMRASLKALREDLAEVLVLGQDGKVTDVHEKISKEDSLGKGQKDRIFRVLAEVRDSYLRIDNALLPTAPNKGYQIVNWKHTRAEIDQVLEACKLARLDAHATEDALLASIFSDAVKTPQNFIVHNIDGAAAAAEVLQRYLEPSAKKNVARLHGIVRAAKEHQIGPPLFMATICKKILAGKLGKENAEKHQATLSSIFEKIAHPFDKKHLVEDGSEIAFDEAEKGLLKQIDVLDWTVPHEGSPWYGASRAVIDGDSLINYASPDGWAKIAALRGPDTQPFFEDATVFDSLHSAKQSYDDAWSVVSEPAKPLMQAGLTRTKGAVKRLRDKMQEWFAAQGPWLPLNPDNTIPFWNTPLKYPSKGPLSAKELEQFRFAKQIREKVVEILRVEQGVY